MLEIATLSAESKATRLQASGNLGGVASNLRFAINTGNLGEIQPILANYRCFQRRCLSSWRGSGHQRDRLRHFFRSADCRAS